MEIPGYTIIRQIGKGGMATVYLAIQESLDRQVALKVVKATQVKDENFTERFLKEGRIIAQFQHPQIITIYDFGSQDPYYYFSMEFLSEGTLAQQIERGLTLQRSLDIIKLIAEALAYAHKRGIIHRDIKPQNILFRQDGTPVLSDFGIAKIVDADTQLTAPGLTIGSPVYMSPEQVTGQKLDSRSDLYSLGIVFYEMLTQKPPYRADDIISVAMMHCTQPVPQLPVGFSRIQPVLQKLLAKKPADRFQSAEQFIQALDQTITQPSFSLLSETIQIVKSVQIALPLKKSWLVGGLLLLIVAIGSALYLIDFRRLDPSASMIAAIELPPASANRSDMTTYYEQFAIKHFQKGEFGQSLELIEMGLKTAPTDARLLALRERAQKYQDATRLLEQAQQRYHDGMIEQSLSLVEEGLRSVPDHSGLVMLRDTLRTQLQHRWQQADQFLLQAHARLRQGALEDSLKLIDQGLQQVPTHPELLTLRDGIQAEISQRQRVAQLLAQARELRQQDALDQSLQRIEEGLRLVPDQPDLVSLRDQVKSAIQTNTITQLLQDCATQFRLDRLSARTGGEAVACYNKIITLAPNNSEARTKLEQLAERYADWASDAIHQADFQLAEDCLAQLGKIKPNHPLFATLSRALQAKREQVTVEVKRKAEEDEARRQAAEEAKRQAAAVRRQAAEEAKRRTEEQAKKPPASPILKPEIAQPSKQSRPVSERTDPPRQKRSKSTDCSEALLKAQLGEPLSNAEREECKR
jgi:serine/threonine-protein kinase PpkA